MQMLRARTTHRTFVKSKTDSCASAVRSATLSSALLVRNGFTEPSVPHATGFATIRMLPTDAHKNE